MKVASFGDPKLYALSVISDALVHSQQPLVPATMFSTGGEIQQSGMLGVLISLLAAEKVGINVANRPQSDSLEAGIQIEK